MRDENRFGECDECGTSLVGIRFPLRNINRRTLEVSYYDAVDYLSCSNCLKTFIVDDSFDYEINKQQYYALGGK